jgi:HAD superfamily hydrolase (TIGR01509 family)
MGSSCLHKCNNPIAPSLTIQFHLAVQPSWGVLFDWDGVVIDSSPEHERSWELLAGERGLRLPEGHFKAGFGKKNEVIIPSLRWAEDPVLVRELADRKEELYRGLVAERGVNILPGARELLEALKEEGIPRSVASSTPRRNLEALFAATGLDTLFDAVVCGDDVSHGKPDPEVFLKAAAALGLDRNNAVVIEDAFAGIEAARRGGMKVVGVATTHPVEALKDCDLAVTSLLEVTPLILGKLLPAP